MMLNNKDRAAGSLSEIIDSYIGQKNPSCLELVYQKPRSLLEANQVIEIFRSRLEKSRMPANHVARSYGVSEKTIRDIWHGRTWKHITWRMDGSETWIPKKSGRPAGSKDRVPRKGRRTGPTALSTAIPTKAQEPSTEAASDSDHLITTPVLPCQWPALDLSAGQSSTKLTNGLNNIHHHRNECSESHPTLSLSVSTNSMISIDDVLFRWVDLTTSCSASQDPFVEDWSC
jgi:hypothetical protein